jgi:hypothetical protein
VAVQTFAARLSARTYGDCALFQSREAAKS